jgi:S-adenosylmethionine hydrolase
VLPAVTLTTDFGVRDAYVAAMKGVMLSIEPTLRLVDVSHDVAPHDVMEAAFLLTQVVPMYPAGTVHLAVVDPDVGTDRRPIAARFRVGAGSHVFVGPDNGLLALLMDGLSKGDESSAPRSETGAANAGVAGIETAVVLDRSEFWRTPKPSRTFHGRDIFGPTAAHIAAGRAVEELGTPIDDLRHLLWAIPLHDDEGVRGYVVHIDRFGNCVTNIPGSLIADDSRATNAKCYIGGAVLRGIHSTYADVPTGEPLMLVGSADYLEVGVNGGNAASLLTIKKGSPVDLVFGEAS